MGHRDAYSRLPHYSSTLSVRQHKKKVSWRNFLFTLLEKQIQY
jgi:hypothetical protein